MKDKRPALMFYVGDWMKSETRAISLAARGLWIDMLCLMHECDPRGVLQHPNGEPFTVKQIAKIVGVDPRRVADLLEECESVGVFSRAENLAIYCRRMVRDEEIKQARSRAGKAGMAKRYDDSVITKDLTNGQQTANKPLTALEKLSSSSSIAGAGSVAGEKPNTPPTPSRGKRPISDPSSTAWIQEEWNRICVPSGLSAMTVWGPSQHGNAIDRLKNYPDRETWTQAFQKASASPFCHGKNDKGWRMTLPALLERSRKDFIGKLIGGAYDGERDDEDAYEKLTPEQRRAAVMAEHRKLAEQNAQRYGA